MARWLESGGSKVLTFHLTQARTGHGCFGSYLKRFHLAASSDCWWCEETEDDPPHTLFVCQRFIVERRDMNRKLGRDMGPKDVERVLCGDEAVRWISNATLWANMRRDEDDRRGEFVRMVTAILTCQEAKERARQAADRAANNNTGGPNRRGRRRRRPIA